ncbi:MAG: SpoIIE family protein phosphatase [Bacteroidia bacterium]|nr:SpoIIE family protein phosphatase [Bacteroidia bacterium]
MNPKKIFILLLCFYLLSPTWAYPFAPSPKSGSNPTENSLLTSTMYWEDSSGLTTFTDAIQQFENGKFQPIKCPMQNLGFSHSSFWMRVSINYPFENQANYFLEISRPTTNEITVFTRNQSNNWEHLTLGDALPYPDSLHFSKPNVFQIRLLPHSENTIYIRIKPNGDIALVGANLYSSEDYNRHELKEQIFLGIFFGIMVFAIFSNLFLFYTLQNRSYLWYVFYVISIVILQISLEGYNATLFFKFSSLIADRSIIILTSATILFVLLYTKKFLNLCTLTNRWPSRLVDGSMVITVLGSLFSFGNDFWFLLGLILVNTSGLSSMIAIVYSLVASRRENRKGNMYFYAAFASLFVGTIIFVLANSNLIPLNFLTYNSLKIGNAIEVIFLSLSMAEQFSLVQKEKEMAQEEALEKLQEINRITDQVNVRLEIEVAQRTKLLNKQNLDLEQKNKDITDSILYAATLQRSMMPEWEILSSVVHDSFLLNLPKDIVSGDFYWVGIHSNKIYFAISDCTGHGVPGAFMSILGVDIFDRQLKNETAPTIDAMLEELDLNLSAVFKGNSNLEIHEHGMDVALCCYDSSTKILEFAGAGRPLYLVKESGEVERFNGNKRSIGSKRLQNIPFEKTAIPIENKVWVYLQSDGYTDQFGGEFNKKIQRKEFEKFLVEIHKLSGRKQKEHFYNNFLNWKREYDQIDDIMVMGVQLS